MLRILIFFLRVLRRVAFLLIFLVLILGSNILLLTVDAAYDAAKRGLWSLASVVADVRNPNTHRGNREALARLIAQTEVFEAKAERLDAELRRSRSEVVELGADNEKVNRRAVRLADENADLDQHLRRTRRELTELSGETLELTADFEAKAERLDAELRRSRSEVVELGADNEKVNRRAVRLADENADLDQHLRRTRRELTELSGETLELTAERAHLSRRLAYLENQVNVLDIPLSKRVSEINGRLARRTSRMIAANMSSMAIEAIPYAGAAAIVGVTFMEVRDACLTLADTREMSLLISGEPEVEVPACGYTPAEFFGILSGGPDATSCRDLNANMPTELRLDCSTIPRPGEPARPNPDSGHELENLRRPGE